MVRGGRVYYIAMEIAWLVSLSDGPAKRFKWKAIEDNNAFDRRGEEGGGADSLSTGWLW